MDAAFWHARWTSGRIGFHQDRVTPLLAAHWDALALPRGSRIFVPLCGKSLDLLWLAARGHRVLGVELSEVAIRQFFDEHGLVPACHASRFGTHFVAGQLELVCGDAFALDATVLADCAGVFDRAALIALPPDLRLRYARDLYARLPPACSGLVVTLEYPQAQKNGPPFAVAESEMRALYADHWILDVLERRDILAREPGFVADGVTALSTVAYRLERRAELT